MVPINTPGNKNSALQASSQSFCARCQRSETQHFRGSTKGNDCDFVGLGSLRRGNAELTAKQMNFMSQIPQPFRCLIEIPFGSTLEVQALMYQGYFHRQQASWL